MQVVARRTLVKFWEREPQAENPLKTWNSMVLQAEWSGPADVKAQFGSVDFVADNRAIFNIGGNKFRLVAHISYEFKSVLIKFVGTHTEYNKIDPATVGLDK